MELNDQARPDDRNLDTGSHENESVDGSTHNESNYITEVSRRLYLDKDTADVIFTFEDSNERIAAHRCILANASEVFHRLLYGPMATNEDIPLGETPTEAFKTVLQFCYLDEVTLKLENITDVMKLLDYYGMIDCLEFCGRFWANNWNIEDICSAYDKAINLRMTEFQEFCERKISVHSDAVFKTDGFLLCSFTVLDRILSLNFLLSDESTVLGACLKWARKQCELNDKDPNNTENLREFLERDPNPNALHQTSLLYKIRYGSMTHDDFLTHMDECNGLYVDVREYEDIMRLLCGKKELKTGKFLIEPRKQAVPLWYEKDLLDYEFLTESRATYSEFHTKQTTSVLTANQPILLCGFQIAKFQTNRIPELISYQAPGEHEYGYLMFQWQMNPITIELKIFERQTNVDGIDLTPKLIYSNQLLCSSIGEPYCELKPNPIILKPEFQYHFQFDFPSNIPVYKYESFKITQENE